MRTGLEASTVTPGSTAPDESLTAPASDCAVATAGARRARPNAQASTVRVVLFSAFIALTPMQIHRRRWVAGYLDRQHSCAVAEVVEPHAKLVEHGQQQVGHVGVLREPQVASTCKPS